MYAWPMLMLRGTTYYYRRSVPLKLRPLLQGRREVWKSLRTSSLDDAKLLSLRVGQEGEWEFQALAKRAASSQSRPEVFAREYQTAALASDAQWRSTRGPVEDDALDAEHALTSTVEDHAEALRVGDSRIVSKLLDEVLQELTFRLDGGPSSLMRSYGHTSRRSRPA